MSKRKFLISLLLAISIMIVQVGSVFAAPVSQAFPPITGIVQSITVETDPNTGVTTVIVDVMDGNQVSQIVRVSEKTAEKLGLVVFDSDGKPVINNSALGQAIEIKLTSVIPDKEENQHPVGSALATFFSDVADNETLYNTIMAAHNNGFGFGVIAQALWLTQELKGDSNVFNALLLAKQAGDYTNFSFDENGTLVTPKNWAELKQAIMGGKKMGNPSLVMSNKDGTGNGSNQDKNANRDKNKGKDNHGNGSGNGNGSGKGNGADK
ncbi:MAG TPA: hypothetical protein VK206_09795 [Anaerolineales bacterium]|nr:hypothetical protein [Anaerolineales bacterium]HLO29536.1 hypothetical protein [Anaerolineales bacterium]